MGFEATTAATFRDDMLAFWASRYLAARNKPLDVEPDGEAYTQADAFAIPVEGLEARALRMTLQIFPDTADDEFVLLHAELIGLARFAPSPATLGVRVAGTASLFVTGLAVTGDTLGAADGTAFLPVDTLGATLDEITLDDNGDGTGDAIIRARAQASGTVGNKPPGTVLIWSSAPAGMVSQGVVTSIVVPGNDEERIDDLAQRVIDWWRERPGSGNRSQWREWGLAVDGVEQVFVYPRYHATLGAGILGAVTLVCLGPAQGDNPDGSARFLSGDVLLAIGNYIEGTGDAHGMPVPDEDEGLQLRPVGMDPADYFPETGIPDPHDVEVFVTNDTANPPPWTGSMTVDAASDATHLVVTGDHTAKNGKDALVQVGTAFIRGAVQKVTLNTGVFATGKTTWTFGGGVLLAAPVASTPVYPGLPNWQSIRLTIFGFFDRLTPGDAAAPSRRWPRESNTNPIVLYRNALCAEVIKAGIGVNNATIPTDPGVDVTPPAKSVVTLAKLIIRPA
jgi:uncharacterized phage protein gp47/JayE